MHWDSLGYPFSVIPSSIVLPAYVFVNSFFFILYSLGGLVNSGNCLVSLVAKASDSGFESAGDRIFLGWVIPVT